MTKWSDEQIQKAKEIAREQSEVNLTTDETIECMNTIVAYGNILMEIYEDQKAKGIDILADDQEPPYK